jgi:hypothetical protein
MMRVGPRVHPRFLAPALHSADTARAMSQDHQKKLLEAYELLNTRFDAPDPETYHGHAGVRS